MRELLNAINEKTIQAKFFMEEENKDLDKATTDMNSSGIVNH